MAFDHHFYQTGIPLIDEQHQQYLELVCELLDACEKTNIRQETIDKALEEVVVYAIHHFDAEEALMLSANYPDYEEHRAKHDLFRDQSDQFCLDSTEGDLTTNEQLEKMTKWLVNWFDRQVRVDDKKLAEFLKNK